jgi:hypothetical protein
MTDISIADLISLVFDNLDETLTRTDPETRLKLRVSSLDVEIPAHVRLLIDPSNTESPKRLLVSLPSPRETPPVLGISRLRFTIETNMLREKPQ